MTEYRNKRYGHVVQMYSYEELRKMKVVCGYNIVRLPTSLTIEAPHHDIRLFDYQVLVASSRNLLFSMDKGFFYSNYAECEHEGQQALSH